MTHLQIAALVLGTAIVSASVSGLCLSLKMRQIVAYMLDALEDKELNFRFDEHRFFFRHYLRTLNRIRDLFEQGKKEIKEQEHFYGQILDQIETGIVTIDLTPRQEGNIVYLNNAALRILSLSNLRHVRQLSFINEELENCFNQITEGKERRCAYYNERGKITLAMNAVETRLQGKAVKIIVFNDVTQEATIHEDLSWNKLIRVLTHEIMNTVTPIASLSETLAKDVNRDRISENELEELRNGLNTITHSSNGLIQFVNNYRKLTHISTPVKSAFFVRELIGEVEHLTSSQRSAAGLDWEYLEKSDDILLYADMHQISQIIVNLVKNAIQAQANKLRITAEIDFAEAVIIKVYNNGIPIESANQDEIFVPFYTTKNDGTGIGLSLSRQIMRLHNGTIILERSDPNGTVFTLTFR